MGWEHFLREEPLSIATWEPFISKSISTGLWELGAEQLQWSNVGRNLGLAAQRQPEGTRVWPRPKLGGVCKMEARFIIEAPLLPHTCEERALGLTTATSFSASSLWAGLHLCNYWEQASSCPKHGGRAEAKPCLVTL